MEPPKMIAKQTLTCKQTRVRAVRFNVDGAYCLTAGDDKKIKLWNPYRGVVLSTFGGHADSVLDAKGSCDSSTIVSCAADRSVILWDVAGGTTIRRYRAHAAPVSCVVFNETSTIAVSGSVDNSVMIWDVTSRKMTPVQTLREAKDSVTAITVNGHEIITASADGYIRNYDVRMGRLTADCVGYPITCVSTTRDAQCYIVGVADGTVKLFDKDSGELLSTYCGHEPADLSIESCSNIDDTHIVSGSTLGQVLYWNLISGACVSRLTHTPGRVVHSLSQHPTEEKLLSACDDTVVLWTKQSEDALIE